MIFSKSSNLTRPAGSLIFDTFCTQRRIITSTNALVIVNGSAFLSGFLFLLRFYSKCTRFSVDVSLLRVNVWSFLCAFQSKLN